MTHNYSGIQQHFAQTNQNEEEDKSGEIEEEGDHVGLVTANTY